MSVIEAVRWGCLPLLPNRISYPEIIPEELHSDFIYQDNRDMADKLAFIIENVSGFQEKRKRLSEKMALFEWEHLGGLYDEVLLHL